MLVGDVEAALQVGAPGLDLAGHQVRGADRVEGKRLSVGIACLHREIETPLAPANALRVVAAQHPKVALRRIRERELAAGRQLLEDLDGLSTPLLGGFVETERDRRPLQPRQVLAQAEPVAERSGERDRALARFESLRVAPG